MMATEAERKSVALLGYSAEDCNWQPYSESENRQLKAWMVIQHTQGKPDNWTRRTQDGLEAHLRHVVFSSVGAGGEPLRGFDTRTGPWRYSSKVAGKLYWWTDYFHLTLPPGKDRIFLSWGRHTLAEALAMADKWAESHGGWEEAGDHA